MAFVVYHVTEFTQSFQFPSLIVISLNQNIVNLFKVLILNK